VTKSGREIMEILGPFDLTGCAHSVAQLARTDRKTVLLRDAGADPAVPAPRPRSVDEAHLLRYEQLETIRMLTNHNLDADSPLACLLIGQPTLRRTMKLAVLAALEQRTALKYAMPPMTSQETSSYISHHLKLTGRSDPLFSDDAASLIHTTSRGYPRAVNSLAIQALVAT